MAARMRSFNNGGSPIETTTFVRPFRPFGGLRLSHLALPAALALLLSACGLPFTDGATHLASDLGDASQQLRQTPQSSLELSHRPLSRPEGVKGPYEIVLQSSADFPRSGGSLLVNDLNSPGYRQWGYSWSTTSHLRHVEVPKPLAIRKPAGECTVLILDRRADGTIEVTALR